MGKTNSLNDEDLREFVELQAMAETGFDCAQPSEKSWLVDIADVACESFDLSVKNQNKAEESALREPQEILEAIALLDAESAEILDAIGGMLSEVLVSTPLNQPETRAERSRSPIFRKRETVNHAPYVYSGMY